MGPDNLQELRAAHEATLEKQSETFSGEDWDSVRGIKNAKDEQFEDLVEFVLKPAVARFQRIAALPTEDRQALSLIEMDLLQEAAVQLREAIEVVRKFDPKRDPTSNPQTRAEIANRVAKNVKEALKRIATCDAVLAVLEHASSREAIAVVRGMTSDASARMDDAHALLGSAQKALATVQQTAVQAQINEHGREFLAAGSRHARSAKGWACAAAALATVLLVAVLLTMFCGEGPPRPEGGWSVAANLGHFTVRAFALSLLSFLLVVCVRNYRAQKHNEISNLHRGAALTTFQKLREASPAGLEDAVLLQATEAIFGAQATGFLDKEEPGATHVVELLKLLRGKPAP